MISTNANYFCLVGSCAAACANGVCSQSLTVPYGQTQSLGGGMCTPSGTNPRAVLLQLAVESTNSAQFNVYTTDTFSTSPTSVYSSVSATNVSCFQVPPVANLVNAVGSSSSIQSSVRCLSASGCPLVFQIATQCAAGKTMFHSITVQMMCLNRIMMMFVQNYARVQVLQVSERKYICENAVRECLA
jgi:hypothetical protein